MTMRTLPTFFISHGGGPWPWMKDQMGGTYGHLEAALKDMPRQLGSTPQVVLVISGHWEEGEFTVMSGPNPPMIYDYSGFPEHTSGSNTPHPVHRERRIGCVGCSNKWASMRGSTRSAASTMARSRR